MGYFRKVVIKINTVVPIKDINLVLDIADYLQQKSERNYVMYLFGIYSGLRISDILSFKVRDVKGKESVYIREKKTGKEKQFALNQELQKAIAGYVSNKKNYEYLFPSPGKKYVPLSRQQAYNIIRSAGLVFGVEHLGTHTLRKTFGYHMYQKTRDAAMLMKLFNHSDIHTTLRYIGVEQDVTDQAIRTLKYRRT